MDFPFDLEEIKKEDELHNKSQSIFDEELETVEKQKRNFCECGGLIVIDISNGVDMCTECRDIKNKIGVDTDLYTTEGSSGISRTCTMSEYGDHAKLYVPNLGYSNANMQHYYNSFNTKNQTLKSVFKHIDRITNIFKISDSVSSDSKRIYNIIINELQISSRGQCRWGVIGFCFLKSFENNKFPKKQCEIATMLADYLKGEKKQFRCPDPKKHKSKDKTICIKCLQQNITKSRNKIYSMTDDNKFTQINTILSSYDYVDGHISELEIQSPWDNLCRHIAKGINKINKHKLDNIEYSLSLGCIMVIKILYEDREKNRWYHPVLGEHKIIKKQDICEKRMLSKVILDKVTCRLFEYIDYLTPTDEEILQIKKDSIDNLPKNPPEIIVKS